MNRFVRPSKYRHLFGTTPKRPDGIYDNLKVSKNAWDSNLVTVNAHFVVTNLESGGGGAFSVLPVEQLGKVADTQAVVSGHGGAVLDTACNPFNDFIVASGSEDQKCMVWKVPEAGLTETMTQPVLTLSGHGRRVGVVSFHPTAEHVLATGSGDMTVKLWDITTGQNRQTMEGHTDVILGLGWNWDGSKFVTTAKDKQMNIYDAHSGQIVQHVEPHAGAKGSRAIYLGNSGYILTTGFSKQSDRQISIWDERNLSEALNTTNVDIGSGMLMPFYDPENKVVYVASRGSGQIRFYEFDDSSLFYLSGTLALLAGQTNVGEDYTSKDPLRGIAFMPKRHLKTNECEVARAYRASVTFVEPISFTVPRKAEDFQADLYPPCPGDEPSLSAEEWFSGKNAEPKLVDLKDGFAAAAPKAFTISAPATPAEPVASVKPTSEKEWADALNASKRENEALTKELENAKIQIRLLETKLSKLSTSSE